MNCKYQKIFWHHKNIQCWQLEEPVESCSNPLQPRTPSPFIIIANKLLSGPVILNIGGKKWVAGSKSIHNFGMFAWCLGPQKLCCDWRSKYIALWLWPNFCSELRHKKWQKGRPLDPGTPSQVLREHTTQRYCCQVTCHLNLQIVLYFYRKWKLISDYFFQILYNWMKLYRLGCLDIGPPLILMNNTSMCDVPGTRFNGTPSTSFQHPDSEDSGIVSLIEVSCAAVHITI